MKPSILIQLDVDAQPSVFDGVVAVDAGVGHLFRHGGVTPGVVRELVHGAMFTRGLDELARTAVFVGGSDAAAAEAVLEAVKATFFGPFRVSVLFDPNGSNTTAAAAVLAALEGLDRHRGRPDGATVAVLATGPVGQRVARLLLGLPGGLGVRIASRTLDRGEAVAATLEQATGRRPEVLATGGSGILAEQLEGVDAVIAAGPAGVTMLSEATLRAARVPVLVDLNAVPPPGIETVAPADKGRELEGGLAWGALGVGGTKMKIHRRAIAELFMANDRVIDAEECLEIGRGL